MKYCETIKKNNLVLYIQYVIIVYETFIYKY